MLVRLPKQILGIAWINEVTILTNVKSSGLTTSEIALVNISTGEIKPLVTGHCPSPSPDRSKIAFIPGTRVSGPVTILDLRTLQQRQLPGDFGANCVWWSPDGKWMAVTTASSWPYSREILIISADNGRVEQTIRSGTYAYIGTVPLELEIDHATWGLDSQTLFFSTWAREVTGIVIISGQDPMIFRGNRYVINRIEGFNLRDRRRFQITTIPRDDRTARNLAYSPDGQRLIFVVASEIHVYDGNSARVVTANGHSPVWSLDSRAMVFARGYKCVSLILCDGDELYSVAFR